MKATGWQAHSVRGFLSGTVGKKMGLTVVSTKGEDGERYLFRSKPEYPQLSRLLAPPGFAPAAFLVSALGQNPQFG